MKPQPTGNDFAAFIGIDWADAKHDICLQAANAARRESSVLPHRPDAIEAWAGALRQRFQGQPIAVCLEFAKGPLVYALQKYDFLVLFPVNPATLAKYRQAFTPSQAKDDPTDAELQLDLLLRHRDKLKPLHPQGVAMRTLQYLVEQRRRLVGDKGRITNRLIYALKQYFPQAVEWFKDKDTMVFCDFLSRWPTLKQAKHAFDAKTTTLAQTLPDYSLFRALPGAAARNSGCIGDYSTPSSYAKRSSNGPARPFLARSGPLPTIGSSVTGDVPTKPPYAPWPSSGFESSIAAGRTARPMTNRHTSMRSNAAARHY